MRGINVRTARIIVGTAGIFVGTDGIFVRRAGIIVGTARIIVDMGRINVRTGGYVVCPRGNEVSGRRREGTDRGNDAGKGEDDLTGVAIETGGLDTVLYVGGASAGPARPLPTKELCKGAGLRPPGNTAWGDILIRSRRGRQPRLIDQVRGVIQSCYSPAAR